MQAPPPALLRFLETKNGRYYERFLELRERASAWLAYIPATFPAYTRHTVDHSDEIILQISKILFEPDSLQPTLPLSAAEAYVIAVAALLHDAGMVVSDAERMSILDSPEWKEWVGRGEPVRRYAAIQEVREEAGAKNADVAHLVADVALRQLIAEFVRGQHHSRSSELVLASEALGRFAAFEDPALLRIIADVCAAHGLDRSALEDPERFPDRLDIQEDVVNVRFIALLVRLGDLLDMRFDRACPMLLQAAAPIPTESLPHWTQYQRITGRLTAPDRIEIRAECATADEDRILRDWCQWIIDEIAGCRSLMHGAKRHGGWAPPGASLDGSAPSIVIRPSKEATYEPAIWRFELDDYAILDRLISDAYVEPLAFVRELLQNALDATRVRVFQDLRARGGEPPATPTMIPEEVRQRFPIVIALRTELQKNAFSGAEEERQILSIEDSGCGMSRDVFQRYFLQVGRSFYQSEEFRRANTFTPTSRFGIGFLSVFGVSDRVTVDTSSSTSQEPALRATLTGPRNYLLLEKSARSVSGTKIELLLSNSIEYSALLSYLLHLCVRVEFPVQIVSEIGLITTVTAEQPSAFVEEFQNDESPPRTFAVRRFPADGPGVEGDLYVFAVVDSEGHESWAEGRFGLSQYPERYPTSRQVVFPEESISLHGLAIAGHGLYSTAVKRSARVDLRGPGFAPTLSRRELQGRSSIAGILTPQWQKVVENHLEAKEFPDSLHRARYIHRLVDGFPELPMWDSYPGTVRVVRNHEEVWLSLDELRELECVRVPMRKFDLSSIPADDIPVLDYTARSTFADLFVGRFFSARRPRSCMSDGASLSVDWELGRAETLPKAREPHVIADLPLPDIACYEIYKIDNSFGSGLVFNSGSKAVRWLQNIKAAADTGAYGITNGAVDRVLDLVFIHCRYGHRAADFMASLDNWRSTPNLPEDLLPPGPDGWGVVRQ